MENARALDKADNNLKVQSSLVTKADVVIDIIIQASCQRTIQNH